MIENLLLKEQMKISKEELAYTAGIIDGEGCIKIYKIDAKTINRPNNRYVLQVQVCMVTKPIVKWLKKKFGGYLYLDKINTYKHPNWQDRQRWLLQNWHCREFLELIFPYVKIKQKQIKLALKFLNLIPGNIKKKHFYWQKCSLLNREGRKRNIK